MSLVKILPSVESTRFAHTFVGTLEERDYKLCMIFLAEEGGYCVNFCSDAIGNQTLLVYNGGVTRLLGEDDTPYNYTSMAYKYLAERIVDDLEKHNA